MTDVEYTAWAPAVDVVTAIFEGEAVLYDASSNGVTRINDTAVAVWQRCNGEVALDQVIDELTASFGATRTEVAEGVRALVRELAARGLLVNSQPDGA